YAALTNAPSRSPEIGPPPMKLPCAHESIRAIDGISVVAPPAFRKDGETNRSSDRCHDADGRRGDSSTAIPGALASTGMMPVDTSTRSNSTTPGDRSGAPDPLGSVMSASPSLNKVWVQVLPCAPDRAGFPALTPPVSTRSVMTSGMEVSSRVKTLALEGSSPSASTVNVLPRGG